MFNTATRLVVEPGRVYRDKNSSRIITLAHVISIMPDGLGIPHVHFLLDMRLPSGTLVREEKRILALESFANNYCDED
ncbi:MAG: hypothetical protein QM523_11305 [Candidatus Pacebacteria bacterium]|nr:hypothetical protein [Candidatus Paceibacterota bacterium]